MQPRDLRTRVDLAGWECPAHEPRQRRSDNSSTESVRFKMGGRSLLNLDGYARHGRLQTARCQLVDCNVHRQGGLHHPACCRAERDIDSLVLRSTPRGTPLSPMLANFISDVSVYAARRRMASAIWEYPWPSGVTNSATHRRSNPRLFMRRDGPAGTIPADPRLSERADCPARPVPPTADRGRENQAADERRTKLADIKEPLSA
jgi:hypothetical protein